MPLSDSVQPVAGDQKQPQKQQFAGRSSMYYFLQNTMQEFPFAWWHKCVLLRSSTISSSEEEIHCSEWVEDSISEKDMLERTSLYDEDDVRATLMRIDGGVTSAVLRNATETLKNILVAALWSFSKTGHRGEAELQSMAATLSDGPARRMARIGAPSNFNMQCYEMAFLPATVSDFVNAGQADGINCAHHMLMWIHNEQANATRYNTRNSRPLMGRPGIQEQCFR